ncbi:MAG: hypothetical protein DRH30_12430 [Deltaproteobacteria bacterium]|nr:MAG: hypothetical protein DRH30_12430 [Deltaproteobacteria bacterium]
MSVSQNSAPSRGGRSAPVAPTTKVRVSSTGSAPPSPPAPPLPAEPPAPPVPPVAVVSSPHPPTGSATNAQTHTQCKTKRPITNSLRAWALRHSSVLPPVASWPLPDDGMTLLLGHVFR